MKSIFTLLIAVLFVSSAAAQGQGLALSTESIVLDANGGIELEDIALSNTSNSIIEIAIRLERICLASSDETRIQICLGSVCFSPVNETTTWLGSAVPNLTLESGDSDNQFRFHQSSYGSHESEWNVVFFDRNNPSSSATLNVSIEDTNLEACIATGTNDFEYTIGKAFPNPVFDVINIAYDIDVNEANLNIYNSTGNLIETIVVNPQAESVAVDVANYVNGVYFYNVTDGKGQSKMMSFVK